MNGGDEGGGGVDVEDSAPPLTQSSGQSRVKYAWIFLFEDNINEEEPFTIVPLTFFRDCHDFPWTFIEGEMSSECRSKVLTFSKMPGKKFRIFGKIEKGENY